MIIDTFMFFNEIDILDIRLRELDKVVDRFVLVEAGETLAGVRKPSFFTTYEGQFSRFTDKIRHVQLPGLPPLVEDTEHSRFWLERFQRDAIMLGLVGSDLMLDDVVLLSDVDEIPSASAVARTSAAIKPGEFHAFKQRMFQGYFDQRLSQEHSGTPWVGTVAFQYRELGRILPHDIRRKITKAGEYLRTQPYNQEVVLVEEGGWHLSYFGGDQAQNFKRANFAHGAGGIYGDPSLVPSTTVSRDTVTGLKSCTPLVREHILDFIATQLGGSVPGAISTDLDSFYHLFKCSYA